MITIISFGYGHLEGAPAAHFTLDARELFRDPHYDPALQALTGLDQPVIDSVMRQEGASVTVRFLLTLALELNAAHGDVTVAVGCVGGRHRSVALVAEMARRLPGPSMIRVIHRDIRKPILPRQPKPTYGVPQEDALVNDAELSSMLDNYDA